MVQKVNHISPLKPQHAPDTWTTPMYGIKGQYAKTPPELPPLLVKLMNLLQQKIGSILYYNRAIDKPSLYVLIERG